ncbi:MAG: biotin/lipoyl-containing protein [Candidatus Zixiibacteriota bacterium]
MELEFIIGDKVHKVGIESRDGRYRVNLGGREHGVESTRISENCVSLLVNGKAITVFVAEADGKTYLSIRGEQFCIQEARAESTRAFEADSTSLKEVPTVCSPMPGKVVKISVKPGDLVEKGQGLVIVEAMKMENEIKSPMKGRVEKVNYKPGDLVDASQPIIEIVAEKPE